VLGKALGSLLFGVAPIDWLTFAAAGLGLVVVGLVAASVPAARAARIDPVLALRQD
jgi:ABC-type antimicrobial peptide transport system permease subunit